MIPLLPTDLSIELYLNSDWVEVISDRYTRDDIIITNGRKDEISAPVPGSCSLTLNNRHGNYSLRNPVGAYYGSIGRNTPIRLTNNIAGDAFGRTSSNGWGTSDTGDVWSVEGTASNYSVSSGAGKHSVGHGSALTSYLDGMAVRDVDVALTVTLPILTITGDIVWPANIVFRGQDTDNYILAGLLIETDESVTISMFEFVDGVFVDVGGEFVVPGLTFSGQALRVRAQMEGHTVRMKVWDASQSEPYGWHGAVRVSTFTGSGFVGVQSSANSGNTNPAPIVFAYDDLLIRLPLFAGEISEWPQRWDLSGNDVYAPVEAAGIRRRLGQGTSPLASALRRGNLAVTPPVLAYWPCEDGKSATTLASAVGGPPMALAGTTDLASYTEFDASAPLPVTKAGAWTGVVPSYTATGEVQLRWVMHVPSNEVADLGLIAQLQTPAVNWEVKYRTGSALSLEGWSGGAQVLDSGPMAFDLIDQDVEVSLELTQSGSNIDWKLAVLVVGNSSGNVGSGTLNSKTLGAATRVVITPYQEVDGLALGHIAVRKEITSLFDVFQELNAWAGETAGDRIARLCDQEGISIGFVGDPADTALMGPQRVGSLLDLLDECALADFGTLCESKGDLGFLYRTRASLYNQVPTFTLDYQGAQVSDPFTPTDDDQQTRNDIEASRIDGGSARATLETGRMSVLDPSEGGAGRYDNSLTVNVASDDQLPDVAVWALHLGTVDETRYPS
ncbi:MAG: hypothetical protein ACRDQH_06000, partial [Pseudonocardiaceae bacterium]